MDGEGLHTTDHKVEAVYQVPKPQNICQLRASLGMLQYYGKFIPHLATLLQPLNALLCKDIKWKWTMECEKAFMKAKEVLSSASVLAHYDPQMPLRLAADASAYEVHGSSYF